MSRNGRRIDVDGDVDAVGDLYGRLVNALTPKQRAEGYRPNDTVMVLPAKTSLFHGTVKNFDPVGMLGGRYFSTNVCSPCGLLWARGDSTKDDGVGGYVHEFELSRLVNLLCVLKKTIVEREYGKTAIHNYVLRHGERALEISGVVRPVEYIAEARLANEINEGTVTTDGPVAMAMKAFAGEEELRLVRPVGELAQYVRSYWTPPGWLETVNMKGGGRLVARRNGTVFPQGPVTDVIVARRMDADGELHLRAVTMDDSALGYSILRQFAMETSYVRDDGSGELVEEDVTVDSGAACAAFAYAATGLRKNLRVVLAYGRGDGDEGCVGPLEDVKVLDEAEYSYSEDARRCDALAIAAWRPSKNKNKSTVYGFGNRVDIEGGDHDRERLNSARRMVVECMIECVAKKIPSLGLFTLINIPNKLSDELAGHLPIGLALVELTRREAETGIGWECEDVVVGADYAVALGAVREAMRREADETGVGKSFPEFCTAVIYGLAIIGGFAPPLFAMTDLPGGWDAVRRGMERMAEMKERWNDEEGFAWKSTRWHGFAGEVHSERRNARELALDVICRCDASDASLDGVVKRLLAAFGVDADEAADLFVRACVKGCANAAARLARHCEKGGFGTRLLKTSAEAMNAAAVVAGLSDDSLRGYYLDLARNELEQRASAQSWTHDRKAKMLRLFRKGTRNCGGLAATLRLDPGRVVSVYESLPRTHLALNADAAVEVRIVYTWRLLATRGSSSACVRELRNATRSTDIIGPVAPWIALADATGLIACAVSDRGDLATVADIISGYVRGGGLSSRSTREAAGEAVRRAVETVVRVLGPVDGVDFAIALLRDRDDASSIDDWFVEAVLQGAVAPKTIAEETVGKGLAILRTRLVDIGDDHLEFLDENIRDSGEWRKRVVSGGHGSSSSTSGKRRKV